MTNYNDEIRNSCIAISKLYSNVMNYEREILNSLRRYHNTYCDISIINNIHILINEYEYLFDRIVVDSNNLTILLVDNLENIPMMIGLTNDVVDFDDDVIPTAIEITNRISFHVKYRNLMYFKNQLNILIQRYKDASPTKRYYNDEDTINCKRMKMDK